MTRPIFLWVLLFLSKCCLCQNKNSSEATSLTKITFINPGIGYEQKTSKFQTLFLRAFFNTGGYFSYSSSLGTSGDFYLDPVVSAQYRFYYNAGRRDSKGKRTEMNSLNYVAPLIETAFLKKALFEDTYYDVKSRRNYTWGAVWGIQRNFKSHFSLDLNVGLGYGYSKSEYTDAYGQNGIDDKSGLSFISNINLGFWLKRDRISKKSELRSSHTKADRTKKSYFPVQELTIATK